VKRATEDLLLAIMGNYFSHPFYGLAFHIPRKPSTEVLGYYQKVRFAD
jgi:hypothetical protein